MAKFHATTQSVFDRVSEQIFNSLHQGEEVTLNLHAEDSLFVRFNGNRVRQNTHVEQRSLNLILQKDHKTANYTFSLSGQPTEDLKRAEHWLNQARRECDLLPEDPFQTPVKNNGQSQITLSGRLLPDEEVVPQITSAAQGSDLAGLYCAGPLISANKNSQGQSHWFANENFFMDYSLYHGPKAAKSVYAGTEWSQHVFLENLTQTRYQLALLQRPPITLKPGAYRTYLAPGAVAELTSVFSWDALSFGSFKQGNSPLHKLAHGEASLSPLFSMQENFALGLAPRFNSLGELTTESTDLVREGRLKTLLISTRSAQEYGVETNKAELGEAPRSLEVLPGTLSKSSIPQELGTGLYLSNLHYLSWSDRMNARLTGMTRYACFWVENGEIVAPIADLRFDDSLYDCLGSNLVAVTDFQEVDPMVLTYEKRAFGGRKVPGLLIDNFKFTL
ncbi:MAG: metallopeptidase TldD-related protein [Bdellovibrio sp.]